MLGKLFKYEWKATAGLLLIFHAAVLVLSVIGRFILLLMKDMSSFSSMLYMTYFFLYIMTIISSFAAVHVIMVSRFYRNMFTDEAYLTHTLPVTMNSQLLAKFVTYLYWCVINLVIIIASVAILLLNGDNFQAAMNGISRAFQSFADTCFNGSAAITVIYGILFALIGFINFILMFYFSLSVGSLFAPHKVLASVVTYILTYIVLQVISLVSLIFLGNNTFFIAVAGVGTNVPAIRVLNFSLIESVILCLIYGGVTWYITNRKLNLE